MRKPVTGLAKADELLCEAEDDLKDGLELCRRAADLLVQALKVVRSKRMLIGKVMAKEGE